MYFGKEFFICEDPKGRIMNTASVGTPSQKMSVGKPGLSLVRDAKPKLLDQLREALRARSLQSPNRADLLQLGKAVHIFPQCPPPRGNG